MRLDDPSGQSLTLTIDGYEFPEIQDHEYDANWLVVTIHLAYAAGAYTASDPCLVTWEVGWLARWLENIARDVLQSTVKYFIEPNLQLEHLPAEGDDVILRVRFSHEMAPPWTDRLEGVTLDFRVPRPQLAAAAASLRAQLDRFPPRAGVDTRPPFTARQLSATFFVDWLLLVPATSSEEATVLAVEYIESIRLEPVVSLCRANPEMPGEWQVRLTTDLGIPADEPLWALFQFLSHLPTFYGSPRIGGPSLSPDGALGCSGELAPTLQDQEDPPTRVRGWFELRNYENERRFRM
ncbi:MAG: hypothetical protein JOZ41_01185 [Chloroflexi bacterium]|nr:hypothetical protein [Chloroflexota bacterium]